MRGLGEDAGVNERFISGKQVFQKAIEFLIKRPRG
jgi:hypothetical protein